MQFLKRLMKNPDEDRDEAEDEFAAEESGLLMETSLPGRTEQVSSPEASPASVTEDALTTAQAETPDPAGTEAQATASEATHPPVAEGGPPELDDQSPKASGEEQSTTEEETAADDPMALFKAAGAHRSHLESIKDELEDISVAELLAEARSIRSSLVGGQSASSGAEEEQRAA